MRVSIVAALLAAFVYVGGSTALAGESKKPQKKSPDAAKLDDPILRQLLLFPNADPDSGPAPLKVAFTADVYEGDEAVKPKYEWIFGDGSAKSHEQSPSHTYKKPGKYTAEVTVKDATGRSGHDKLEIEVETPQ